MTDDQIIPGADGSVEEAVTPVEGEMPAQAPIEEEAATEAPAAE